MIIVLRTTGYHSDRYLLRSKIFLPYKYSAWNNEEEKGQNTKKIKNIKYKVENLMQDNKNIRKYWMRN